ncbi:hypothetical protein TNCV_1248011 [Trichonephila clavipes]|nr:hypothetical protein TNCV_1248011 [Trichonephila clavipes]
MLYLLRAQTSSRWCGLVGRRGEFQLRCRPRHLAMVQNNEISRQKLPPTHTVSGVPVELSFSLLTVAYIYEVRRQ